MGASNTASEMATLVCVTLENDQESAKAIEGIVRAWLPRNLADRRTDEQIGRRICIWLGERLDVPSKAEPRKLPSDSPVNLVWMTFIGNVAWAEVGKYFRQMWED